MNDIKNKPKTVSDIRKSFKDKYKSNRGKGKDKHYSSEKAKIDTELELLAYYSTPEGRREIDNSPHSHLSTMEAVALLMQDVYIIADEELSKDA